MPRPPAAALFASPDDVEAAFYEALQRGDLDALMALWADDDEVVCVHPGGGGRLVGPAAIRASFEAIFAHSGIPVVPEQVHRLHRVAHRVVWVNPHRGKVGYEPVQQGVLAVLPHVDDFVAGHSLATYSELCEVISRA